MRGRGRKQTDWGNRGAGLQWRDKKCPRRTPLRLLQSPCRTTSSQIKDRWPQEDHQPSQNLGWGGEQKIASDRPCILSGRPARPGCALKSLFFAAELPGWWHGGQT